MFPKPPYPPRRSSPSCSLSIIFQAPCPFTQFEPSLLNEPLLPSFSCFYQTSSQKSEYIFRVNNKNKINVLKISMVNLFLANIPFLYPWKHQTRGQTRGHIWVFPITLNTLTLKRYNWLLGLALMSIRTYSSLLGKQKQHSNCLYFITFARFKKTGQKYIIPNLKNRRVKT